MKITTIMSECSPKVAVFSRTRSLSDHCGALRPETARYMDSSSWFPKIELGALRRACEVVSGISAQVCTTQPVVHTLWSPGAQTSRKKAPSSSQQ